MSRDDANGAEFALDPRRVRRAFSRAARDYDGSAILQTRVRDELLDRLQWVRVEPSVIVDLGAGTGHASVALKRRYRASRVIAADLSPGMLREAASHRGLLRRFDVLCADAARLPLRTASVDIVFSNLMLQWCSDPDAVFSECRRVLKPGGLLTYTTFGPDTLVELRRAWATVDDLTHVNRFIDMHDLGDAMIRSGFAAPVMDVERCTLTYADAHALMRDLKAIGAHNSQRGSGSCPHGQVTAHAHDRRPTRRSGARVGCRRPTRSSTVRRGLPGLRLPVTRRVTGEVRIPVSRITRR
jgi:malonyl-CoA O-methyltransferase